jgi:hypothetical protein
LEKKRGRVREREGALDAIKVVIFDASNLLAGTLGGFFLSDANAMTGASGRKRDDNGWRRAWKEGVEKSSA